MRSAVVQRVIIHHLTIGLKQRVDHAAAQRKISEPIFVAVELMDGTVGYGETLARQYVTGESDQSVIETVRDEFAPRLIDFRPPSFGDALEAIDALPMINRKGECATAARAGLELALLDACSRSFDRPLDLLPGWMGMASFGNPGSSRSVRFSGVLAAQEPQRLHRTLRMLYCYGIRQFKLKVGFDNDDERMDVVMSKLRRAIQSKKATLRLDANGGWSLDRATAQLERWSGFSIQSVEQPLDRHDDQQLIRLFSETRMPIVLDESLVTLDDATRLIDMGVASGFNIRISKCGGLIPALRLAELARKRGVTIQLGCMVGETSLLSAAGLRFLAMTPGVIHAEGCFGSFLMAEDVCDRSLRFGYGGRLPKLGACGLGVSVDPVRLERLSEGRRTVIEL